MILWWLLASCPLPLSNSLLHYDMIQKSLCLGRTEIAPHCLGLGAVRMVQSNRIADNNLRVTKIVLIPGSPNRPQARTGYGVSILHSPSSPAKANVLFQLGVTAKIQLRWDVNNSV